MGWLRGWLVLWLNNVIKDSRAFYVLCHSQPASLSPASSFHVPTKTGIFQARSEHIKGPSVPKKSCLGTDLPQVSVDRIITPAHARSLMRSWAGDGTATTTTMSFDGRNTPIDTGTKSALYYKVFVFIHICILCTYSVYYINTVMSALKLQNLVFG